MSYRTPTKSSYNKTRKHNSDFSIGWFQHFVKNFLRPYGRSIIPEEVEDEALDNRLETFNCEWLTRPSVAVSQFAETMLRNKDVTPALNDITDKRAFEHYQLHLRNIITEVQPLWDNPGNSANKVEMTKDVISNRLQRLEQLMYYQKSSFLDRYLDVMIEAGNSMFVSALHLKMLSFLMRNKGNWASKFRSAPEHDQFVKNPDVAAFADIVFKGYIARQDQTLLPLAPPKRRKISEFMSASQSSDNIGYDVRRSLLTAVRSSKSSYVRKCNGNQALLQQPQKNYLHIFAHQRSAQIRPMPQQNTQISTCPLYVQPPLPVIQSRLLHNNVRESVSRYFQQTERVSTLQASGQSVSDPKPTSILHHVNQQQIQFPTDVHRYSDTLTDASYSQVPLISTDIIQPAFQGSQYQIRTPTTSANIRPIQTCFYKQQSPSNAVSLPAYTRSFFEGHHTTDSMQCATPVSSNAFQHSSQSAFKINNVIVPRAKQIENVTNNVSYDMLSVTNRTEPSFHVVSHSDANPEQDYTTNSSKKKTKSK